MSRSLHYSGLLLLLGVCGVLVTAYPVASATSATVDVQATPTFVDENVTTDTTWAVEDSPFRIIANISVENGSTLTIEPGVEVQFAIDKSLTVQGSLIAEGTAANGILFTSSKLSPQAGDWNTVRFRGGTNSSFRLKHTEFEYAQRAVTIDSRQRATIRRSEFHTNSVGVRVAGATDVVIERSTFRENTNGVATGTEPVSNVRIIDSVVEQNSNVGIRVRATRFEDARFANVTLTDNGNEGALIGSVEGEVTVTNVTVAGSTISTNGDDGLSIVSGGSNATISELTVTGTTVSNNSNDGLSVVSEGDDATISNATITGNTVSGNGGDGIAIVSDGGAATVANITITGNTVSNNGNNGVSVSAVAGDPDRAAVHAVTISRNTLADNDLDGLSIAGEGGETHVYDVGIDGDEISDNGENGIAIAAIERGGGGNGFLYNTTIRNETILRNANDGIRVESEGSHAGVVSLHETTLLQNGAGVVVSGPVRTNLTNSSIGYNERHGVLYSEGTTNVAKYNDIYKNAFGMNVSNGATVVAEHNYWGASSGPFHPSVRPEGEGNPVNGNGEDLDFVPWLESPSVGVIERPTARLAVERTRVPVGEAVTLNGSASTDDGAVSEYRFVFGDGNSTRTTSPRVSHTYAEPGVYRVSLTVTDDFGLESPNTDRKTIWVVRADNPFSDPIVSGGGVPLDPDGDGLYEDVNGDGTANFTDAVDLAFVDEGGLTRAQIEALDFDGDGDVDFDDAVELAFLV